MGPAVGDTLTPRVLLGLVLVLVPVLALVLVPLASSRGMIIVETVPSLFTITRFTTLRTLVVPDSDGAEGATTGEVPEGGGGGDAVGEVVVGRSVWVVVIVFSGDNEGVRAEADCAGGSVVGDVVEDDSDGFVVDVVVVDGGGGGDDACVGLCDVVVGWEEEEEGRPDFVVFGVLAVLFLVVLLLVLVGNGEGSVSLFTPVLTFVLVLLLLLLS